MPIEGVIEMSCVEPAIRTGRASASSSLRATWAIASRLRTPGSSTMNSSPPKRATRSVLRTRSPRRLARVLSSASPAAWPSESLTRLKWSRSMNSSASRVSEARAATIRCSSWLNSAWRLARPVSAS